MMPRPGGQWHGHRYCKARDAACVPQRELEALIPLLKEHCDSEDYATYGKGVAMVLATMSTELTGKLLAAHPELNKEIDADIAKYGRYFSAADNAGRRVT
jgi:hypothetical protein